MTEIRYAAFEDIEGPSGGPLRDAFNAVLNVFGDIASKNGGTCPGSLAFRFLAARMSGELCLSPQIATKRLKALIDGQYLVEEYAQIHFPKEGLKCPT